MGREARKRRSRKASIRASRRAAQREATVAPDSVFASIVRDARGLADATALDAEQLASTIYGATAPLLEREPEARETFHSELIASLRRRPTSDSVAFLLGLAAVGEGTIRDAAASASETLVRQGVKAPAWADEIGRATFTGAWLATDEFGDQDFVVIGFEGTEGEHTLSALIDHNLGGLAKDLMLAPTGPEKVLSIWREIPENDLEPGEIPAEDACARVRDAIRAYDETFDPPSTDAVRSLRRLFLARLAQLPTPLPRPQPARISPEERGSLAAEFLASPHAPAGESTEFLATTFLDFKVDYADGDALRWSPTAVELCMLDWFPRKVSLEPDEISALPEALRGWVRFAGERRGISAAGIRETLDAITTFEPEFLQSMADDAHAGPAKAIAAAMAAEGIDLTDQGAVTQWIDGFNARSEADRDAVLGGLDVGSDLPDDVERELLAIPDVEGTYDGIDLNTLDPLDPDDRSIMIRAEHQDPDPALHDAATASDPDLHLAVHEIIANQLLDNEPPQVWQTARRLMALGHEEHVVLHMLGFAMSAQIFSALREQRPYDPAEYRRALDALPDSWTSFVPDTDS